MPMPKCTEPNAAIQVSRHSELAKFAQGIQTYYIRAFEFMYAYVHGAELQVLG
jgi:hypothetical protein